MGIRKHSNPSTAQQYADDVLSRLHALPKPKVTVSGKLLPKDKKVLRSHFESKGLSLASGITMIIKEYMGREGIG